MSIMTIQNQHVGKMLVGPHAQERWRERSAKESLKDSLERAIPFGGQYGDNLLLIDGEIVFACEKYGRAFFVKTVLTKDQAVANMEFSQGCHRVYNTEVNPKELKKLKTQKLGGDGREFQGGLVTLAIPPQDALFERHKHSKTPVKDTLKEVCSLFKKNDVDFELAKTDPSLQGCRWKEVISHIQKLRQRTPLAVDDVASLFGKTDEDLEAVAEGEGKIAHIAKQVVAQRNRLKKQKKHADLMHKESVSLKKAMCEFISPEIVAQIYHMAALVRDSDESVS